jgi:hypothetical protein
MIHTGSDTKNPGQCGFVNPNQNSKEKKMKIYSRDGEVLWENPVEKTLRGVDLSGVNLSNASLARANLSNANLTDANLYRAILTDADLAGANLYNANLTDAYLYRANLYNANLKGARLQNADLYNANLTDANLYKANLTDATLYRANLYNANLYRAILTDANLSNANLARASLARANLSNTTLVNANLTGACLARANLSNTTLPPHQIVPPEGEFIGWKVASGLIIKLKILANSKRVNAIGSRKCRTDRAQVIGIYRKGCSQFSAHSVNSDRDPQFIYSLGSFIEEPKYDPDITVECSRGIHFFLTRDEAEAW